MSRKDDLQKIVYKEGSQNEIKADQLISEIIFIEEQLVELKKLPFIKVHPKDPTKQKPTAAAKQYKELLQQYNSSLRLLFRLMGDLGESEEESPLRKWIHAREEMQADE